MCYKSCSILSQDKKTSEPEYCRQISSAQSHLLDPIATWKKSLHGFTPLSVSI